MRLRASKVPAGFQVKTVRPFDGLTDVQLNRLAWRILASRTRGETWDWPTFAATFPVAYAALGRIRGELERRAK